MEFNIPKLPQYTLACKDYEAAIDIKQTLKDFRKGAYEIWTIAQGHKITLKYGETTQPQGERIYRQVWRVAGWPTDPAVFAAGDDFDWVRDQFPGLVKDNVYVTIWDLTRVKALNPLCAELETFALEAQLIKEYVDIHGYAPIGNRKENQRLEQGRRATKLEPVYSVMGHFLDWDIK
jgi:hypothetical protein